MPVAIGVALRSVHLNVLSKMDVRLHLMHWTETESGTWMMEL